MASDPNPQSLTAEDRKASGEMAFRRFCMPRFSRYRSADHDELVERARFHLRNATAIRLAVGASDLQAYVFEPEGSWNGSSILLVHGWTAEAAFMTAFAEHFRKRGFRVVLFDFPAHGKSLPETASLIDCAHAVREVAEALGPIQFVLAHSLGGMAALLAAGGRKPMPRGYPFKAFVLVAMPNHFANVLEAFSQDEGLSPATRTAFDERMEEVAHRRVVDFTGVNLLAEAGRPALIMHARDDADIAFAEAEEMIAACPTRLELHAFDDLGHRKILYAPPAVRAATAFLLRAHAALMA
ncbi:MAG TPA: alpha/beta hydrolase, partial [Hyphomicrobiaceae bacterium]|nr:alpha/beta hydrolase [Hyphomicrobiaceae bacterium]